MTDQPTATEELIAGLLDARHHEFHGVLSAASCSCGWAVSDPNLGDRTQYNEWLVHHWSAAFDAVLAHPRLLECLVERGVLRQVGYGEGHSVWEWDGLDLDTPASGWALTDDLVPPPWDAPVPVYVPVAAQEVE